jgi:hypothetical protein
LDAILQAVSGAFESALSAVLSAAAGAVLTTLLLWAKISLPARLAWRVSDHETTNFIVATLRSEGPPYRRLGSGLGEIRAIGILLPTFIRAYKTFNGDKVLLSETVVDGDPLHLNDIIILGGPKWNKVTLQFLEKMKMSTNLPYTMDDVGIIDEKGRRLPTSVVDGKVIEDYGLIIKAKNPFNKKTRGLLFAGAHTYGVHAAALAFSSQLTRVRYLWRQNYVCLVRCDVTGEFIGRPEIIAIRGIKQNRHVRGELLSDKK